MFWRALGFSAIIPGMTRSGRLRSAGAALIACSLLAYATRIEPGRLACTKIPIGSGRLARTLPGCTIAVLSDLHFGASEEPAADKALLLLREIRPDLILLAGDYVAWGSRGDAYERALDFLAKLEAPLGVYGVLGDADRTYSRRSCEFCHQAGSGAPTKRHRVAFLKNESRVIAVPGGALRIVGLEPGFPRPAAPRLRALLAGDLPTILISHSSIVYRDIDPDKDVLTVSGDTHGGQVWLPRWLWRLARFKPDPEHPNGYFHDGRKSLVVSRGIGTSHVRLRLGARPEVVILEFAAAKAERS